MDVPDSLPAAQTTATSRVGIQLAGARRFWRDFSRDRLAVVGLAVLILLLGAGILARWVAPYDPNDQILSDTLVPPAFLSGGSLQHLLGTDQLGRDLFSRILYGIGTTFQVAVSTVALAGTIGVTLGLMAGFFGGRIDQVIMGLSDIQLSFPGLLIAMLMVTIFHAGVGTVILALALNGWMLYARIVRGRVLELRSQPFVEAATALGASGRRIMLRHLLPNTVGALSAIVLLELARISLAEASLSFLGFGVQPPVVSLGLLLAAGREFLAVAWWPVTFPGITISMIVLALHLVANGLRRTISRSGS